jgi:hypothetical protein|tara:strand:+ start:587 stop:895 length:309 start_codon:yes stop_codon:yes gene_type:complete
VKNNSLVKREIEGSNPSHTTIKIKILSKTKEIRELIDKIKTQTRQELDKVVNLELTILEEMTACQDFDRISFTATYNFWTENKEKNIKRIITEELSQEYTEL